LNEKPTKGGIFIYLVNALLFVACHKKEGDLMFEWWFVIFFWFNPLYWIIGLAVIYEVKSLKDRILRALFWLMVPFLSFVLLLLLCYFAKVVYVIYAFNLMVLFLVSALLILGLLIYKICKKEMKEKGEI